MWVEKVKDGYQYREPYVDPMTGKHRKVTVTMSTNSRTAQKAAHEALQAKINAARIKTIRSHANRPHRRLCRIKEEIC